jgi:hypothetical protein
VGCGRKQNSKSYACERLKRTRYQSTPADHSGAILEALAWVLSALPPVAIEITLTRASGFGDGVQVIPARELLVLSSLNHRETVPSDPPSTFATSACVQRFTLTRASGFADGVQALPDPAMVVESSPNQSLTVWRPTPSTFATSACVQRFTLTRASGFGDAVQVLPDPVLVVDSSPSQSLTVCCATPSTFATSACVQRYSNVWESLHDSQTVGFSRDFYPVVPSVVPHSAREPYLPEQNRPGNASPDSISPRFPSDSPGLKRMRRL